MNAPTTPGVSAQVAIINANACFVQAFQTRNATGIAKPYAAGGRLLLAQTSILTGRHAIQAFWQGMLDMGIYCTERKSSEIQSAATLANEIGTYVLCLPNGQVADQGIYIALWQWMEGQWQIRYEVWRSRRLTPGMNSLRSVAH